MSDEIAQRADSVFYRYEPRRWHSGSSEIYSLPMALGLRLGYELHNANDEINEGRDELEKVLLEYTINDSSFSLFTVNDLLNFDHKLEPTNSGNIIGRIAEKISWLVTSSFLERNLGELNGLTDKDAPREKDYVVANNEEYVLKIKSYPNLVLLKNNGVGKYGYENIKELDSMFDYTVFNRKEIIVMESKTGRINIEPNTLVERLFNPLRCLYPNANFSYVLFADASLIYDNYHNEKRRQMRSLPIQIYKTLKDDNISSLFFGFNETRRDFFAIRDHIIAQNMAINNNGIYMKGSTFISDKDIIFFDNRETPHLRLRKDKSGLWEEVALPHKSRKQKKGKEKKSS